MSIQIHAEDNSIVISENRSNKKVKVRAEAFKKKSDISLKKKANVNPQLMLNLK